MSALHHTDSHVTVGDASLFVRRIPHAKTVKPTLVFLHDSLGCVETWRDFPDALAQRLELPALVVDRQGYGQSSPFGSTARTPDYLSAEATTLFELLDILNIHRVVLFGHSDGGSIALLAAAQQPNRVDAVVTEGAHVFVEELTLAGLREARHALATTDLPQRLERYHGDKVPAIVSAWLDTWLSAAFRDWNIEPHLPRIRCPLLAIQGVEDEFGSPAQVDAIVHGVGSTARALMIPDIGHTPHREARHEVLDAANVFVSAAIAKTSD